MDVGYYVECLDGIDDGVGVVCWQCVGIVVEELCECCVGDVVVWCVEEIVDCVVFGVVVGEGDFQCVVFEGFVCIVGDQVDVVVQGQYLWIGEVGGCGFGGGEVFMYLGSGGVVVQVECCFVFVVWCVEVVVVFVGD